MENRHVTMVRPSLSLRIAAATLLALAAVVLPLRSARAEEPAHHPMVADYEVGFMEKMIDHHGMAVEMAHVCLEKHLPHEKLTDLCEEIHDDQTEEILTLREWLRDWYGSDHSPRMKPEDRQMLGHLASLNGAEFETEFMEMMIDHHHKAIIEAEECTDRAEHEELVRLCRSIIRTQSAEIDLIQRWLCDWYGRCQSGNEERSHERVHGHGIQDSAHH